MYNSIRRTLHLVIITVVALAAATPGRVSAEDKAARIDELLKMYHEYGQFNGAALIAEGGAIIHKAGYGQADMEWENERGEMETVHLKPGDVIENKPGRKHRMTAVSDLRLIEVSTPELDDVVRIEDDYRRS